MSVVRPDGYGVNGVGIPAERTLSQPGTVLVADFRGLADGVFRFYTVSATNGGFQFQSRLTKSSTEAPEIPAFFRGSPVDLRQTVAAQIEVLEKFWTPQPGSLAARVPLEVLRDLYAVLTGQKPPASAN